MFALARRLPLVDKLVHPLDFSLVELLVANLLQGDVVVRVAQLLRHRHRVDVRVFEKAEVNLGEKCGIHIRDLAVFIRGETQAEILVEGDVETLGG